jgi:hypothetical protein
VAAAVVSTLAAQAVQAAIAQRLAFPWLLGLRSRLLLVVGVMVQQPQAQKAARVQTRFLARLHQQAAVVVVHLAPRQVKQVALEVLVVTERRQVQVTKVATHLSKVMQEEQQVILVVQVAVAVHQKLEKLDTALVMVMVEQEELHLIA